MEESVQKQKGFARRSSSPQKSLKECKERQMNQKGGKNVTKATDVLSAFLINFL